MAIYEMTKDSVTGMEVTKFADANILEHDLQRLLRDNIGVLSQSSAGDADLLVIAEEFSEWKGSNRRIDLLAIDKDANLVVIELKRTEDGGHMDLQAIRYAAMVSAMTFARAAKVFADHLNNLGRDEDAEQSMLDFLDWDEPDEEEFAQEVRIVLASAEFSRELTTAVLWLNERQLDIRCVRLKPYRDGVRTLIDVQQIIPLPEAATYQVQLREKQQSERESRRVQRQWNGRDWYCNFDSKESHRQWADGRKYGYVAAGQGERWGPRLEKLPVGGRVFVYSPGHGYVGVGIVDEPAATIDQFAVRVEGREMPILKAPLESDGMHKNAGHPIRSEYLVRVRWLGTCGLDNAFFQKGLFSSQHVACKMRDAATINAVEEHFDLKPERDEL